MHETHPTPFGRPLKITTIGTNYAKRVGAYGIAYLSSSRKDKYYFQGHCLY